MIGTEKTPVGTPLLSGASEPRLEQRTHRGADTGVIGGDDHENAGKDFVLMRITARAVHRVGHVHDPHRAQDAPVLLAAEDTAEVLPAAVRLVHAADLGWHSQDVGYRRHLGLRLGAIAEGAVHLGVVPIPLGLLPVGIRGRVMVVREEHCPAAGANHLEAKRLRPLGELEDGARLVPCGQRVDDARAPRSLGKDWPHDHVRLHVEHHHVPVVLDGIGCHPSPHFGQPSRLHQCIQFQLRHQAAVACRHRSTNPQSVLCRTQLIGHHRFGAVLAQTSFGAPEVHVGGRHHPDTRHG